MSSNPYEEESLLSEYLLFHYGSATEILPWPNGPVEALGFPIRTAAACTKFLQSPSNNGHALDLGCAVGRSSFELARHFSHVTGMDFSRTFIAAAESLASGKPVTYRRIDEGGLATNLTARRPEFPNSGETHFIHGDAMDLPAAWHGFDLVHAANLLCRLPEPMRLIHRLPELIRPAGLLVLATPCTWLESYTPEKNWLGGFHQNGKPVYTIDRLRAVLSDHFDALETRDEPFLIREHARKYQWSVASLSIWRRK